MKITKPKEWEFSLFYNTSKGLFNTFPMQTISLQRLFDIYQSPYLQEKSIELSTATDEQKVVIKSQLPFITYSGAYSYRNNESILTYNSSLLPLDIDNLPTKQDAIDIQFHLSLQKGCVMSCVSPRGKGVKAFFYLGCEIELNNHYHTLKENVSLIAQELGIGEWEKYIDTAQFVQSQPFFIGWNKHSFFSSCAIPTEWKIEEVKKKEVILTPPTRTKHTPTPNSIEQKRIHKYIDKITEKVEDFFFELNGSNRHPNIWRVGGVKKYIHYAAGMEGEIKERLFNAVVGMYESKEEAINVRAVISFNAIWNNTDKEDNIILEQIIKEEEAKRKLEEEEKNKKRLTEKSIN
jgi:hypothetical protein